jgi:hypothetical protein
MSQGKYKTFKVDIKLKAHSFTLAKFDSKKVSEIQGDQIELSFADWATFESPLRFCELIK